MKRGAHLAIQGLTVRARGAPHSAPVLREVSLAVEPGTSLAVVGESGSGKSTLARCILGLMPRGLYRTSGCIQLDGEDLTQAPLKRLQALRGSTLGLILQDALAALNPVRTVGAQLYEARERAAFIGGDRDLQSSREACIVALRRVQIPEPEACLDRFPHQLSGGMRQRVLFAAAVLARPRLLIADEPTSALDPVTRRELLAHLLELTASGGTTLVLITHDIDHVARACDRIAVLQGGLVECVVPAAELAANPATPYVRKLVTARDPEQLRSLRTASRSRQGETLMSLRGVSVHRGQAQRTRTLLDSVYVELGAGEVLGVAGASGSGKSTLGRTLLGLMPGARGEMTFCGHRVQAGSLGRLPALRHCVQLIFQDPAASLDPRLTVLASTAEPLVAQGMGRRERLRRAAILLDEVGLAGFGERLPFELSGGQRQRVAIARALIGNPRLVVADEPVSALDPTIQFKVLATLLGQQKRTGFALVLISHDLDVLARCADRLLVLDAGRIVEQGALPAVLGSPASEVTRALAAACAPVGPH